MNRKTNLVLAYYNQDKLLTQDFIKLLRASILKFNCSVIYIGNIQNIDESPEEVKFTKYGDAGYDGNCYKEGLKQLIKNQTKVKIIFFNNSIEITSSTEFLDLLLNINTELDNFFFLGYSKSKEIKNHYQSFLFAINLNKANIKTFRFLNKFLQSNTPLSRSQVIDDFEIRTIEILDRLNSKHGFYNQINRIEKFRAYANFLLQFGYINNPLGLLQPNTINFSLYNKNTTEKHGFRKIKNGKGQLPWGKLRYFLRKK